MSEKKRGTIPVSPATDRSIEARIKQKRRSWKLTENGNILLKLRMKSGDDEQPLGLFFQEVHTQDGRLMVVAKLVPLIYTTQGFYYDFQRARPSWFTTEEFREFLDALNTLGSEPRNDK